jgi:hypothetical protein
MYKTLQVIIEEFPHIWNSRTYYQQTKKDVTLEIKGAQLN